MFCEELLGADIIDASGAEPGDTGPGWTASMLVSTGPDREASILATDNQALASRVLLTLPQFDTFLG